MGFIYCLYGLGGNVMRFYPLWVNSIIINNFYSLWSQALFLVVLGGGICFITRNLRLKKNSKIPTIEFLYQKR